MPPQVLKRVTNVTQNPLWFLEAAGPNTARTLAKRSQERVMQERKWLEFLRKSGYLTPLGDIKPCEDLMREHVKPLPSYLVGRYQGWHATSYAENRAWYRRLAEEGQRPRLDDHRLL